MLEANDKQILEPRGTLRNTRKKYKKMNIE